MPIARDVLNSSDPTNPGLFPYLRDRLGGDWDRFQIRPWNFKSVEPAPSDGLLADNDNNSGFRWGELTEERSPDQRTRKVGLEVRIGYILTGTDSYELQFSVLELALRINDVVQNWSCCTQWTSECIDVSVGGFAYSPNPTISSGNPSAWAISIARSFKLIFEEEMSQ